MAEFIEVREVGLRDGIQNIKTVVPTDLKLAWIKAEVAAGVRDIEVCSFVPPKLLPQFADAEEVTKGALADSRPHRRGADAEPEGRGTRRRARRAPARLCRVGEREPQHEQRAPLDRGLARRPAAHRGLPQDHPGGQASAAAVRACDLVRLHAGGQRAARSRGAVRRNGRGDAASTRSRSPTRSASPIRTRSARCFRASQGDRPGHRARRAFPRHARAWHRECLRRDRCRRAPLRCVAVRARRLSVGARRDRQHRHRGRGVPRRVARLQHRHRSRQTGRGARDRAGGLPNEALYGQVAKAGLPKGFSYAEARKAA